MNQVAVFILTSPKRKKTKLNYEEWQDKLSQSIKLFMTAQAQNDKEFSKKLFGEKSSVESGDDDTILIKVQNYGEHFFIEMDLERSD